MAIQLVVTTASASDINVEVVPVANQTITIDRGIAGPVGMIWRGDWSSATTYSANDAVYYAATNASYICILANTNQVPTDITYWQLICAGAGNVTGAVSSSDNAIARFDGTTGKVIQNSAATIDDAGNLTLSTGTANGVSYLNASKVLTTGSALTFDGTTLGLLAGAGPEIRLSDSAYYSYVKSVPVGANSTLAFGTSAAEGMRLTSTGLGVGTSSPSFSLDQRGDSGVQMSNASNNNALRFVPGSGVYNINMAGSTHELVFADLNGAAELMRLTSTSLGIGTSSPSFTAGSGIHLYRASGATVRIQDASTDFDILSFGGNANFTNRSNGALVFGTNNAERMRIDSEGNLYTANGKIGPNATQQHTMPAVASDTYTLNAASQTLSNKTINSPVVSGSITEGVFAIVDGASVNLTPSNGTIQTWTLGASRTPTATGFNSGQSMTLMINDGTAFTVTWTTAAVTWVGGSAPILATTGFTVIELWKVNTVLYGAIVGYVA